MRVRTAVLLSLLLATSMRAAPGTSLVRHGFQTLGDMTAPRGLQTTTLLPDGRILIVGGFQDENTRQASAEVFDPATRTFTAVASVSAPRAGHTATLLPNGKVLVAGGDSNSTTLTSAELFDPGTDTFTPTGSLSTARSFHTATLLRNGKVLLTAGSSGSGKTATAEIYDPAAGTFTPTGSISNARSMHTATLLADGRVFIYGGSSGNSTFNGAALYDPATSTFTPSASAGSRRFGHSATLLADGRVLIAGGMHRDGDIYGMTIGYRTDADIYDPATDTFGTPAPLVTPHYRHAATLLPDGRVLITGGEESGVTKTTCEIFDPATGGFTATDSLSAARSGHNAILLPDSRVLILGGATIENATVTLLASTEMSTPDMNGTWEAGGELTTPRRSHTATPLLDGKILITGGYDGAYQTAAELYDPSNGTLAPTGPMTTPRAYHRATLLADGRVLVSGGFNSGGAVGSAELFDPASGTFGVTGSLQHARSHHGATLLANGQVLITGGFHSSALGSAEIYDPGSGTFSTSGPLLFARANHTATLLHDGRVLIGGGFGGGYPTTAELYDPMTRSFATTGTLDGREGHSASLLADGTVLVAGGYDGSYLASASRYDPATGLFSETGSLATARQLHTATVLPTGRILFVGGSNASGSDAPTEMYDPASGTFSGDTAPGVLRSRHTATLMSDGRVLIVGGSGATGTLGSSEVFDPGAGFAGSRRPLITTAPVSVVQPGTIDLAGSAFRGDSEGSSGSPHSSPTDYPLLHLQRIDNEQSEFIAGEAVSDTNWSGEIAGLAAGPWRVTIVTNAIPSLQRLLAIQPPLLAAPAGVIATATSSTAIDVAWTPSAGASAYEVLRSSDGVTYGVVGAVAGTGFTDSGVTGGTAYLYAVRASIPAVSSPSPRDLATTIQFTDDPIANGITVVKAAHLMELRAAVAAVQTLAGTSGAPLTDSPLTAGVTIQGAHVTALRSALDAARSALSLPALSYGRTLTPQTTVVHGADFVELRSGVK